MHTTISNKMPSEYTRRLY